MERATHETPDWKATFFTIWGGQALSLFGSQLVSFALIWWLTVKTGSATVLAMAALVALLPDVLLAPFAGALIDRWDRRAVMMAADGLVALATAGLAALSALGCLQSWHIYAIMLIRAIGGAFHWPAMAASTSLMVPKEHLSRVAGLNQTLQGARSIVSPPLAALLIGLLPLHAVMLIDVGTAALAIVPLCFVPVPQPQRTAANGLAQVTVWDDLAEGLRYVWAWPGLRLLAVMGALFMLIIQPAYTLVPLLVTQRFHGGAIHLGWLQSLYGAGIVAGGLALSAWGGFRRRIVTSRLGLAGFGLATVLLGLTPAGAFGMAMAVTFFLGLSFPFTDGPLAAALQASVSPEMQGRVFTLLSAAVSLASSLGLAIAGPLAEAFGVSVWLVIGGVVCMAMGGAGLLIPAVVNLEDGRPAPMAVGIEPRLSTQ